METEMARKLVHITFIGLIASVVSACWVPVQTGERMQAELVQLQREVQRADKHIDEQGAKLEEQSQQLAQQMQKAAEKIAEVAEALQNLNRAARMTDADMGVQIERLIKEVQELRGAVELADYRTGKIQGHFEGDNSLVHRVEALESGRSDPISSATAPKRSSAKPARATRSVKPKATPKKNPATASAAPSGATPPPPAPPPIAAKAKPKTKTKKELLSHGETLIKRGQITEARGVLRDLVRRYPNAPGVTDKAYFSLGEIYFKGKKYRSALQEYIKVVDRFPQGKMADDAYFRIGTCSMEIGNLEDAQIFFNEIVSNHKKSPLLKAAKTKLLEVKKRLSKEQKQKKKA